MWPFKAQARVSELREELAEVKGQLKRQKLDLDDLWDRFSRLSGRIAKRNAREDNADAVPASEAEEVAATTVPLSPSFSRLSPHQRRVQSQILARRANGGGT